MATLETYTIAEPKPHIDSEWIRSFVRRRHMHFLLPFFIAWLLIWIISWVLPVRYKSTTTILVQQPTVPLNYVAPNISVNLQTRLASLTQQILSRTRLLLIAKRLDLYGNRELPSTPDALVNSMRKDISIALVRDPTSADISGFTVSYSAPTPHIAQRVTNELTHLFIENNQLTLQRESEDTTRFLQQQLDKARASLAEQESKVKQFQSAHLGSLPAQETSNLQILSGLQSQLQNDEDSLGAAQQQQTYLQSLIEQYAAMQAPAALGNGHTSTLSEVDAQIAQMTSQLSILKTRYTERYPAVRDLEARIQAATRERAQINEARTKSMSGQSTSGTVGATPVSLSSPSSPTFLQLKSQLEATRTEIRNRQHDIASLKHRIDSYQGRLNAAPAVEAELSDLNRGYNQSQANYNDLLKKESDSAMATSMEQMQQGERFSVLDPPSLPLYPDSPNRVRLSLIGLACGLAFGLLVAGMTEFLDDRLYRDEDIVRLLPVAVIGEIPEVSTEIELQHAKTRLRLGWFVAGLVVFIVMSGSLYNYFNPSGPAFHPSSYLAHRHV